MRKYKTKQRPKREPKSANDCVIQVRCKSTTLATLLKYRRDEGWIVGVNQSTLARDALETLERMIISERPEMEFTSITHARDFLESSGFLRLNVGYEKRGEQTAFRLMQTEAIRGADRHISIDDLTDDDIRRMAEIEAERQRKKKLETS